MSTISNKLLEHRKSARSLRSNVQDLLMQPTCKTKTYGDRSFSVCAPKLCNTIPLETRQSSTVLLLKKKNLRPSFLLDLLRVTLYIFNFLVFNFLFLNFLIVAFEIIL